MRSPRTRSGQVWFEQHFAHMTTLLQSGRTDAVAMREAARALQYLLQREPGYGLEVRQLALHFVMGTWNAGWTDVIVDAVRTGCDADLSSADLRNVPVPAALLHVYSAEMWRLQGDRLRGMRSLERALRRLRQSSTDNPLATFVAGRVHMLQGELQEIGQESVQAHAAFLQARGILGPLMASPTLLEAITLEWTLQVFGRGDGSGEVEGMAAIALQQFSDTHVRTLFGALRTAPGSPSETEVAALRDAVRVEGLGTTMNAAVVLPLLARMSPADASALGTFLADAASSARAHLARRGLLQGLAPDIRALVERSLDAPDDDMAARLWTTVTEVAVARSLEACSDPNAASDVLRALLGQLVRQPDSALGMAIAMGEYARLLATYSEDRDRVGKMADSFCGVLEEAARGSPEAFLDLRLRSLFDDIIASIAAFILLAPMPPDAAQMLRVSELLDLLRLPDMPAISSPRRDTTEDGDQDALADGSRAASNSLQRMVDSVAVAVPEVVAVVVLAVRPARQLLLVVDRKGLSVHRTADEFALAAACLEEEAELALMRAGVGVESSEADALELAARRVWSALPPGVCDAIARADILLLAPDHRPLAEAVPWELVHDGTDYLMHLKPLGRFVSLRQLASALDTPAPHSSTRRAIVVSASEAIADRPLSTAVPECQQVRIGLRENGFDAPDIEEPRFDADFLTDRLGWIDVLHVAAHGESLAGTEYLALPDGRRLSVDDLLARQQKSMPFAYLNTCQLGRTRYLGGGRSRGLAFTLSELGSPAVVANTADVLDDIATDLAIHFYEEAMFQPVGAALLAARRHMQATTHPCLVARVILFGDPLTSLVGPSALRPPHDAASRYLDIYFDGRPEEERRSALEDPDLETSLSTGGLRALAAVRLIEGFGSIDPEEDSFEDCLARLAQAVALADELRHFGAMALIRYARAAWTMERGDSERDRALMREAVYFLRKLPPDNGFAANALSVLRSELRRRELGDRGIKARFLGPADDSGVLEAVVDQMYAAAQAQEDDAAPVALRDDEDGLEDILWNAVVAGYPNRFEDALEAASYAAIVTRKLISRGFADAMQESVMHASLTGLLWWIWTSQNTTYLDPEVVEGQVGTLRVALAQMESKPLLEGSEPWRHAVRSYPALVESTVEAMLAVPWAQSHVEIPRGMETLRVCAQDLLASIAVEAPAFLGAAAAYLTGVVAVKDVFTPVDGQDQMHKHMTAVLWDLNAGNEERFMGYLMAGFERVRMREQDELARWRSI